MSNQRVADFVTEVLAEAGVTRIYGVSGDSLNGITDSLRTKQAKLHHQYARGRSGSQ